MSWRIWGLGPERGRETSAAALQLCNELEELLAAIGGGDIRLNQMVNFLQSQFNKPSAEEQDAAALKQLQ